MAKQLNVKLNFDADTSRAKQQIQDLQNTLNNVINAPTDKLGAGISTNIQAAIKDVANLQYELNKATNADTGKIDFTKLNHSITKSGKSLQQYGQQLMSLGPMGQQAFGQLAQAIASSEIPVFRVSNKLKELGITLANTARWQLSSSVLHGFMGAVQSAYGYAQDLNESLNNIRIVTGQNVDQMAKFASEANKAAKALSATTTEYTNASLIYYQQGLNDQQVKERTDVTIKMANVARESAETVSDQMTAVWNNFYDGSKSLEYYADVMTALGAATASSTAEISEGLNKFAAVAETVGLSYEYATAALATVTATTRQSADVVGTAFKTLFARIQDLELGNTLDDGTTLGSYSQALEKVGINIIDTSGNLKQMDVILEEMAARWDTLGQAEQTALAQNVAGVRQYTQLIALMENWDFMKENLSTASNATGALQAQADIYAESWEAAQDRVRAAAEKIYSSLINEDFFIDLTNGFEDILSVLGKFIDSIGGVKGVLSTVGVLLTSIFSDKIAQGITNMSLAMQSMTPGGRAKIADQRTATMEGLKADFARYQSNADSLAGQVERGNVSNTLDISNLMLQNEQKMSDLEKDQNRRLIERLQLLQQEHLERAKSLDILRQELEYTQKRLEAKAKAKGQSENYANFVGASTAIDTITKQTMDLDFNSKSLDVGSTAKAIKAELAPVLTEYKGLDVELNLLDDVQEAKDLSATLDLILGQLYNTKEAAEGVLTDNGFTTKELDHIPKTLENIDAQQRRVDASGKEVKNTFETLSKEIPNAKGAQKDWSTALVAGAQAAMSAAMMINSLRGAINTLKDPDISGWEKFTSVLMSLGMTIPGLVNIWKTLKSVISQETIAKIANMAATWGQVKAEKALKNVKNDGKDIVGKSIRDTWNENAFKGSKNIKDLGNGQYEYTYFSKDVTKKLTGTKEELLPHVGKDALNNLKTFGKNLGLVAIGIALITTTIAIAKNQWEKYNKAADQAAKASVMVAEAYKNASEAYDEFVDGVTSYKNLRKEIDGLTEGTVEYQEAVLKANEEAMKLLDTYDNLSYSIKDGLIEIDQASLELERRRQLEQLGQAKTAQYSAEIAASNIQKRADINNFNKKLDSNSDDLRTFGNAVGVGGGVGLGAAALAAGLVAFFSGPVGWAALIAGLTVGVTGAVVAGVKGSESPEEKDAIQKIANFVKQDGNALFALSRDEFINKLQSIGIEDEELCEALERNRDALEDLTNATLKQEKSERDKFNQAFIARMSNDPIWQKEDTNQDFVLEEAWKVYQENQSKDYLSGLTNAELLNQYRALILNDSEGKQYKFEDTGRKGVTVMTAAEGGGWEQQGEKNSLSYDYVRQALNEYYRIGASGDNILDFVESYNVKSKELNSNFNNGTTIVGTELEKAILLALSQGIGAIDLSKYNYEDVLKLSDYDFSSMTPLRFPKGFQLLRPPVDEYQQILQKSLQELREKVQYKYIQENEAWFEQLSNEEKTLFWSIEFDKEVTNDQIKDIWEETQSYFRNHKITVTLEASENLTDLLSKEKKISEDWTNIKTQYTEMQRTNPNMMPWEEFFALSQIEQQRYINHIRRNTITTGLLTSSRDIEVAEKNKSEDESWIETATLGLNEANEKEAGAWTNLETYRKQIIGDLIPVIQYWFGGQSEEVEGALKKLSAKELEEVYSSVKKLQEGQNISNDNDLINLYSELNNTIWGNVIGFDTAQSVLMTRDDPDLKPELKQTYTGNKTAKELQGEYEQAVTGKNEAQDNYDKAMASTNHYEEVVKNGQLITDAFEQLVTDSGQKLEDVNSYAALLAEDINKDTTLKMALEDLGYDINMMAKLMALAQMNAAQGLNDFADNMEEWSLIVDDGTSDMIKALMLPKIKEAFATMLGVDVSDIEHLGLDFFRTNWELMQDAIDGSDKNAVEKLQYLSTEEFLRSNGYNNIDIDNEDFDDNGRLTAEFIDELNKIENKAIVQKVLQLLGVMGDFADDGRLKGGTYLGAGNDNIDGTTWDLLNLTDPYQKERYKPEDYQIAKNNKNLEQLYGQNAVEAYRDVESSYAQKQGRAQEYLSQDAEALKEIIGETQYNNFLDKDGKFNVDKLMAQHDSLYNSLSDDADKKAFDEAVNQILETNDVIIETSEQMRDAVFNRLTKSLENQLEANDNRLSEIELALSTYGDDIENAAERLSLLFNNDSTQLSQWEIYTDKVNDYQKALTELDNAYDNREISQEQYAQGLEKIKDGSASAAKELIELNNQLRTYYEDVLSNGKEELADYTDHMEHVTEVTEHYKNVLGLIGKLGLKEETNSYAESMRKLNEYARTSIKNRKEVAEEYYKDLAKQVEYWNAQVNQTGLTEDQKKFYEEQRDAAIDAADEAQKELFSLTESWLEAEKALIEFELEELANALEKQLTGSFGTFEDLLDQFDKLNTRQEEYLTETNKMYETNKMMAEANKLLDETTNKAAKQKISNFINETKKLQENTQLSEFELELQQAKYDLLLAEIALEEARGAKSTVRLTRDNEGNFGYVYTADQEAIFDAEQKVADAENKLYNKSLEGQQKYQEQYFKAAESMFQELTELNMAWLNNEIESEEAYNLKRQEILEHYFGENGILRTYSNLYNIAIQANADATADNWFNNYDRMGKDADAFGLNLDGLKAKTENYLVSAEDKTTSYKEIAAKAYEEVEDAINSVVEGDEEDGGLTKLMQESDALVKQLTDENGLLDALSDETTKVGELATAYGSVITKVQGLIDTAKGINSDVIGKLNTLLDPTGNPEMGGTTPPPNANPETGKGEGGKDEKLNTNASNYSFIGKDYYVQDGETLWGIGIKLGITPGTSEWYDWIAANGLNINDYIYGPSSGRQTVLRYNTGGYTGSWGPSAKLAWLDEKELVLNADDTENILRTVSFVRELASLIDSQASMSNISGFFTSPGIGNHNSTLEQKVEIHAEFPYATDRYEIEEAFTSLVNRASQYANRKW